MKRIKYIIFMGILVSGLFLNTNPVTAQSRNVYTVQKGDTIWSISQKYQANFMDTLNMNKHFEDPDMIYPGDKVYIPKPNRARLQDLRERLTRYRRPEAQEPEMDNNNMEQPQTPQEDMDIPEETPQQETPQQDQAPAADASISALEQEVVRLVNVERQKQGLQPYKHNSQVSSIARRKSEDMRDKNYFSHQSPTYGSPFEMLNQFGVEFTAAGENIAKGQKTAQAVMNSWMNSPGHRKNILSEKFTEIGVGLAKNANGTTYWTQMFIRP
jgi:uncharacterized YkwD family protein